MQMIFKIILNDGKWPMKNDDESRSEMEVIWSRQEEDASDLISLESKVDVMTRESFNQNINKKIKSLYFRG